MTYHYDGPWQETLYAPEHWARIPANQQMWFSPDSAQEADERLQAGWLFRASFWASLMQRQQHVDAQPRRPAYAPKPLQQESRPYFKQKNKS